MMFPNDRPEPAPNPMLKLLGEALDRSDFQFRQNNDILNRRGNEVAYLPGYIDARLNTTTGTHNGRIFHANAYNDVLELHPTDVTNPAHSLPAEVTYLRADTIETMQVTFTFEGTFEVAITHDDLNQILDRLHEIATGTDGDASTKIGAAMSEAINVFGQNAAPALRETLDIAERNWRIFETRTLNKASATTGVLRGGWYLTAETDKDDNPHYGEIAFQHTHANMPTDYLYADTRDRVCNALIEHISPF